MDETSPVYENFLNQMKRFRRPIRETTRRISSSKFLNRDEDKNIKEIKDLTGSILETLKKQEKIEVEAFLDLQRRYENDRRREREAKLEAKRPVRDFLVNRAKKIASPIVGFLESILRFILTVFFGRALVKLLEFLANPENEKIVDLIGKFFSSKFGFVTTAVVALGVAASGLIVTLGAATAKLLGSSVLSGLGGGLPNLGFLKNFKALFTGKVPITGAGGKIISGRGIGSSLQIGKKTKDFFSFLGSLGTFLKTRNLNKGGEVDENEPVFVGDNPDGSINKTTELFVPSKAGTIIPNSGIKGFLNRRLNRGSLNPFGQTKVSSGAAGRIRTPVFSGRPYQGSKMFGQGPGFATRNVSTARTYTNPSLLKGLPGTGGTINPKGTLDTGKLPNRYIQKFGSKSILGQDQIKMSRSAYAKTFGVKTMQGSTRSMLGLGKGLLKRLPLLDLMMDLAFPQPLADGTLTNAQQRNIPGTPVVRNNKAMDTSSFNITEVANQFKQQLNDQNSETDNETFSVNLPLGDPKVYEIYGADIGL
tara:strand:+ start:1603 stop:3204 length:1602 start_codon:yes stop_codon:yes gene_type:complete